MTAALSEPVPGMPRTQKAHLRLIGDVHGKIDWNILGRPSYLDRVGECEHSIQIGDMGDTEAYEFLGRSVDPERHRFFPGNHDDYDNLPPHCLGDYGSWQLGELTGFFVRGAYSVDKQIRLRDGIPWWPAEELGEGCIDDLLASYRRVKPSIMLSHDGPWSLCGQLVDSRSTEPYGYHRDFLKTRTGKLLERLFEIHEPDLWVFGHYHRDWHCRIGGTRFYCLGELSCLDLDGDGSVLRLWPAR